MISLLTGVAKPDLLQLITTDSAPDHHPCVAAAGVGVEPDWVAMQRRGRRSAGAGDRAAGLSYVSMPPEADHDVAADLARLMTPFAERYGVINVP